MSDANPLQKVWSRADAHEARFSWDEVALWPEGWEVILREAGAVARDANSMSITCDACHEGHVEELTLIESPPGSPLRAYICCPTAGRVAVPLERLRQWKVDFHGLAEAINDSLHLAGEVEEVLQARLWSLGKATIAGRVRELFLARGTTWPDALVSFGPCARLNASRGALVLVPGDMPPPDVCGGEGQTVVPLKLVGHLEGDRLAIDRDHLECLLAENRRKAPIKAQESFPTPPGTRWHEVMVWVADSTITIEAKRRSHNFGFEAAGFEEKRKRGVPDRIWSVLKVFAMHGGDIPYDGTGLDHSVRTNLKHYVSELRKRLRALIPGVDGDPIPHVKDDRCYRMAFKIATSEGVTFPVPSGMQWPNVTITLVQSDAIRVSVPATERFAASTYAEESGNDFHQWDTAERESGLERDYDLRMLGLADEDGQPDAKGRALIEILRANGSLSRPADDYAMLNLCGVLTKLMDGIGGSPFDFAPGKQKWIAFFNAGSDV